MKQIVFVSDAIYPYNKAGKDKRLYEISTRLAQRGYDVHVYTMKWWDGPEKSRVENGVTLHAICKKRPLYAHGRRSITQGVFFGLACLKLIGAHFDIIDVDHMPYFPLYFTWVACMLRRKKMYATWHEVWGPEYWREYMGAMGMISSLLERVSVKLPTKIISVSQLTSGRLSDWLNFNGTIHTVPCGVDLEAIDKLAPSKITHDIIYFGRLIKHKNVDMVISAIAKCVADGHDISCLIVGEGPEKENLKKLAIKFDLSNHIQFVDYLDSHDELYSLVKSSKIFAFPSAREGFGIVAIEANACGIPVLTLDHPDNASKFLIKDGENGYVISNVEELAEKMEILLSEKSVNRQKYIDSVESYDWRSVVDSLLEAYA